MTLLPMNSQMMTVFTSPGSIAFNVFSYQVHYYGIVMAFAIMLGLFTILIIRKKFYKEISSDTIFDISFVLIIFGIITARAYYVLLDYRYFMNHPSEIICIWNGGISIQGAILGGIAAFYIFAREKCLDFFKYADLFSFGVVAGQIAGRWGNFFNSEAFGLPCDLPWKLYIPYSMRPLEYKDYEFFHPAFLYESVLNIFVLLIMLLILYKKPERRSGTIFFVYIILYSFVRMLVESIRIDSVLNIFNIHIAHISSVIFLIFGISGLIILYSKKIVKN